MRRDVIALWVNWVPGKRLWSKGTAQGLGVKDKRAVKSPTFSLVHDMKAGYHYISFLMHTDFKDAQEMLISWEHDEIV